MTTTTRTVLTVRDWLPAVARQQKADVLSRLRELAADETIEIERRTWPNRVALDATHDVVETYREYARWASTADVDLEPAFSTHRRECEFTGIDEDILVLPAMALAVYEDDVLTGVYPHVDDGTPVTVMEGINRLERVEPATPSTPIASDD